MPSKNSINRPKLTASLKRKNKHLAAKRLRRERAGEFSPARSSTQSKSGKVRSVPLELYFAQQASQTSGNDGVVMGPAVLTRKKLSKKKAQKIARDLRHIQRQHEREKKALSGAIDVDGDVDGDGDMNVDAGGSSRSMQRKMEIAKAKMNKNNLSLIKDALWKALENNTPNSLLVVGGQGTTLGGPFFP